ncbi:hypothetical protein SVAN01_00268 [Stagonosporopsis vannaccii]|nr:hypothetical protein SVAN01_00268 [Stagonosporopsis vannaccii]
MAAPDARSVAAASRTAWDADESRARSTLCRESRNQTHTCRNQYNSLANYSRHRASCRRSAVHVSGPKSTVPGQLTLSMPMLDCLVGLLRIGLAWQFAGNGCSSWRSRTALCSRRRSTCLSAAQQPSNQSIHHVQLALLLVLG